MNTEIKKRPPAFFRLYSSGPNGEEAHTVQVLGMKEGHSIICAAPIVRGVAIFPSEDDVLTLKTFHSRSAFTIKTSLIEASTSPYPLLHLKWPELGDVKKSVMRQSRRANTALACSISFSLAGGAKREKVSGSVINVSLSGLAFFIEKGLARPETDVDIFFELPLDEEGEHPLSVKAKIVRNEETPDGYILGACFEARFGKIDRLAMSAYINGLIADSLEEPPFPLLEDTKPQRSWSLEELTKIVESGSAED